MTKNVSLNSACNLNWQLPIVQYLLELIAFLLKISPLEINFVCSQILGTIFLRCFRELFSNSNFTELCVVSVQRYGLEVVRTRHPETQLLATCFQLYLCVIFDYSQNKFIIHDVVSSASRWCCWVCNNLGLQSEKTGQKVLNKSSCIWVHVQKKSWEI